MIFPPKKLVPFAPFPPVTWMPEGIDLRSELDRHETYIKQTYRNRYEILGPNKVQMLTVPVCSQNGQKMSMKDIRIADSNWKRVHHHAIRTAYGKAPYFLHMEEDLYNLFEDKHVFLWDFCYDTILLLRPYFRFVNFELFNLTNIPGDDHSYDYDNTVALTDLCKPGQAGRTDLPPYPQVFSDRFPFVGGLSSLDLAMNVGPYALDYALMLKKGEKAA